MNKFIITLIFTLTVLIFSNVESMGQTCSCPSGYTTVSFDYPYTSTCTFSITYCVICHPTGNIEMRLCGLTFDYGNNECDYIVLSSQLYGEVRKAALIHVANNLCGSQIQPCPQRKIIEYQQGMCQEIVNDTFNDLIYVRNCDDSGHCITETEVCWDGSNLSIEDDEEVDTEQGDCFGFSPIIDFDNLGNLTDECFITCPTLLPE